MVKTASSKSKAEEFSLEGDPGFQDATLSSDDNESVNEEFEIKWANHLTPNYSLELSVDLAWKAVWDTPLPLTMYTLDHPEPIGLVLRDPDSGGIWMIGGGVDLDAAIDLLEKSFLGRIAERSFARDCSEEQAKVALKLELALRAGIFEEIVRSEIQEFDSPEQQV